MDIYELSSTQYANRFYVRECAEVFRRVYGGTINEIHQQDVYDSDQETTKQESQTE